MRTLLTINIISNALSVLIVFRLSVLHFVDYTTFPVEGLIVINYLRWLVRVPTVLRTSTREEAFALLSVGNTTNTV